MEPVVRIELNGSKALLSHEEVMDNLVAHGWDGFINIFEGFNLKAAQAFNQTFDGVRDKIGDLELDVTEGSIEEATGFPQEGNCWFKNIKFEGVPWHSQMASKKSCYSEKGTPIVLFKP
jgi:hypothetical protein